jgi:hypothetical protein
MAMNKDGNSSSLIASHPGNLNAVKQGVHSPRLIQARAAEIAAELMLNCSGALGGGILIIRRNSDGYSEPDHR